MKRQNRVKLGNFTVNRYKNMKEIVNGTKTDTVLNEKKNAKTGLKFLVFGYYPKIVNKSQNGSVGAR